MKKVVAITLFLLILISSATAAKQYSTVIYDDDLNEHFTIEGWLNSQDQEKINVAVSYNLNLTHHNLNSTRIDQLEISLTDGRETIAAEKAEDLNIQSNQTKSGFLEINSDKRPDRVIEVSFKINHTSTAQNGEKRSLYSEGRINHKINSQYPEILAFYTNETEVHRGQNISVRARASEIQGLKIQGKNMTEVSNNTFESEVKVPRKINEGPSDLKYELVTENGNKFTENISISVKNKAPRLNTTHPSEVESGQDLEINLETRDDHEVNQTHVVFQDQNHSLENGQVSLPTSSLEKGLYNFTAVALDKEGGKTRKQYQFKVLEKAEEENTDNKETDPDDTEIEEKEDKEPADSFPEILVNPLMDFLKNLL